MAIVKLLKPHVGRVVIANPLQVRVIAEAKAKTDRIDAAALARLHAAGYLPEVWQPDETTELLRNLVSRRTAIVQGMTRTKNRIHAVLHANLIPPFAGKLFLGPGRKWLAEQPLSTHERAAVDRWLAGLDGMEQELTAAEAAIATACLGDDRVKPEAGVGNGMTRCCGLPLTVEQVSFLPGVRHEGLRLVEEREARLLAVRETLNSSIAEGDASSDSELEAELDERAAHLARADYRARRLIYLTAVRRVLATILAFITRESGSLALARAFVDALRQQCRKLASLPGTLGRPQLELRSDIRQLCLPGLRDLLPLSGG